MITDLLVSFFECQINEIINDKFLKEGIKYELVVSKNINFKPYNEDGISIVFNFGNVSKISPAYKGCYQNFNAIIYSELGTNGNYTSEIFNTLFEKYSKKSITLIDSDNTSYSIFLDFGDLVILNERINSGTSYRCSFSMTGSMIFSSSIEIGRHLYVAFDNKNWNEVLELNPSESRDNNNKLNITQTAIKIINGKPQFSGYFTIVLCNDDVSSHFLNYIHQKEDIASFSLKYNYPNFEFIEENLKLQNASITLDENTKYNVITISYTKEG